MPIYIHTVIYSDSYQSVPMNIVVATHSVYRRIWHCVQSTSAAIARTPQSCGYKDPERYSYCTVLYAVLPPRQKRGRPMI